MAPSPIHLPKTYKIIPQTPHPSELSGSMHGGGHTLEKVQNPRIHHQAGLNCTSWTPKKKPLIFLNIDLK